MMGAMMIWLGITHMIGIASVARCYRKSKWLVVIKRFSVCFNLFVILFLLTPDLVVALQPCMKWTQLKKELRLNKKDIYKVIHCNLLCQMTSANFFEQVEQKHHYSGVLADSGLLKELQWHSFENFFFFF